MSDPAKSAVSQTGSATAESTGSTGSTAATAALAQPTSSAAKSRLGQFFTAGSGGKEWL